MQFESERGISHLNLLVMFEQKEASLFNNNELFKFKQNNSEDSANWHNRFI